MTGPLSLRAADLIFDAVPHTSKTPDGRDVPHVTHILSAVRVAVDFDELAASSKDRAEAIEFRRALGTAVHADCHAYDDRDLNMQTLASPTRPYVEAWATFLKNQRLLTVERERRVFHPTHWYTGTLDAVCVREDNCDRRILVDIKIGDPDDSGCRFQTAAYAAAWELEHPDQRIDERWGVQLTPELKIPYRIFKYTDRIAYPDYWRDGLKFQAFCVTYREQAARRRAA